MVIPDKPRSGADPIHSVARDDRPQMNRSGRTDTLAEHKANGYGVRALFRF
jgi:hypothetical protein